MSKRSKKPLKSARTMYPAGRKTDSTLRCTSRQREQQLRGNYSWKQLLDLSTAAPYRSE